MSRGSSLLLSLTERGLAALDYRRLSARAQMWVGATAISAFVVGAIVSWRQIDSTLTDLNLGPLFWIVTTAPLPFLLSAAEFKASARALGQFASWNHSMQISILGYAANLLPLPGSSLLRIASLTSGVNARIAKPAAVTLIIGASWLTIACVAAGAGLLALGTHAVGIVLISVSVLVGVVVVTGTIRLNPYRGATRFLTSVLLLEVSFMIVASFRTFLAFLVLSETTSVTAAVVVAASSALSTAVAVVPSGFGVREGLAALLAGLVGIQPALGFLASTILRLAGMLTATVVGAVSLLIRRLRLAKEGCAPAD